MHKGLNTHSPLFAEPKNEAKLRNGQVASVTIQPLIKAALPPFFAQNKERSWLLTRKMKAGISTQSTVGINLKTRDGSARRRIKKCQTRYPVTGRRKAPVDFDPMVKDADTQKSNTAHHKRGPENSRARNAVRRRKNDCLVSNPIYA